MTNNKIYYYHRASNLQGLTKASSTEMQSAIIYIKYRIENTATVDGWKRVQNRELNL